MRCFSSPRSRPYAYGFSAGQFGNPGINARLTAPPGLSQFSTPFIASWRQDIPHTPLVAWPHLSCSRFVTSPGPYGPRLAMHLEPDLLPATDPTCVGPVTIQFSLRTHCRELARNFNASPSPHPPPERSACAERSTLQSCDCNS